MLKKYLSFFLLLLSVGGINPQISLAQINTDDLKENKRIDNLRAKVSRIGLGKHARVVVKLKNGGQLAGYISQAIEDSFDLTDPVSRGFITIPYRDVAEIEEQESTKSTRMSGKTFLIIGILTTLIVLSVIKRNRGTSPRCPLFGC